ncbi:MAG: M56 family metallopeptidase [Longimicrobiales bacterium]
MIGYGMLYATAVGVPILLAAIAGAAALRRYGKPERGVWLVGLGLVLTLPVVFLISLSAGASSEASGTVAETGVPAAASAALPETGVLGLPAVVVVSVEQSGLGLDEILVLAWLVASVVLTLRWMVAARRLARTGASWPVRMLGGVRAWLTPDLGPAVAGVFRTRILVPSWLLSLPEEQRSLVLLHEEEHVRAKDPLLMAASRIARILAPWNPVVWLLSAQLLHSVELDCDRRVLRRRPDIATYGDTLLTVSARESALDSRPLVGAAAFAEAEVPLRRRIIAMTTPPRAVTALGALTVLALGVVLLVSSCEVPVPIAIGPQEQEDEKSYYVPKNDVVYVSIGRDGSVHVNEEPYAMEDLSEVVGRMYRESERRLIVSIVGNGEVPYQFMDQLQDELVAAGVVRVVYAVRDSVASRADPRDVQDLLDQGLEMVVGAARAVYEAAASLAIRLREDDDARAVEVRGLAVVLPAETSEGSDPRPRSLSSVNIRPRNLLHLHVQPNGLVDVKRGASPQTQTVGPERIEGIWRQEVAENRNIIADVKTHPDTPYRYMVEVLNALHSADAERISLRILEDYSTTSTRTNPFVQQQ